VASYWEKRAKIIRWSRVKRWLELAHAKPTLVETYKKQVEQGEAFDDADGLVDFLWVEGIKKKEPHALLVMLWLVTHNRICRGKLRLTVEAIRRVTPHVG